MKVINPLVLFLSLLCADIVRLQKCGDAVNQYRERIQMQGPPGKVGPAAEIDYGKLMKLTLAVVKEEMAKLKSEMKSEIEELRSDITLKIEKMFSESDKKHSETNSRIGKVLTEIEDLAMNAGELNSTLEKIQTAVDTKLENIRSEMTEIRTEVEKVAAETAKGEMTTMKSDATKESIRSGLKLGIARITSHVKNNTNTISSLRKSLVDIENIKTASEANTLAETYEKEKQYIRSIAIYYSAGKMDKSQGDYGVKYKQWRVQDIRLVVEKMRDEDEDLSAAKFLAIPLMEELLGELRQITGASHELKVEFQAWCLRDIGLCYGYFDNYQNDFKKNVEAINLMKRELGLNAKKYRILAYSLDHVAKTAWRLEDYTTALSYYEEALEVFQSVTDLPSEAVRREQIATAKNNIDIVKRKLGIE